jgi:hypothetical protein
MSRKLYSPEEIIMALHQAQAAPAGAENLEELWIAALIRNLSLSPKPSISRGYPAFLA